MSNPTQWWNFNAQDLDKTVSRMSSRPFASVVAGVDVVRLNLGDAVLGVFDASKDRHPRVPHHTFEIAM